MALVIDGAAMARLTSGRDGPCARHLIERATVFQQAARAEVQPHSKSRCLERSIVKRPIVETGEGLSITVTADTTGCAVDASGRATRTSYSLFVHEGTAPHVITAAPGGPALAFFWAHGPNGPGTYFFREVHHPGTQPIPFLADNLPLFAI